MNLLSTLRLWKLFKIISTSAIIFWIIETTFFLIRDGWHLKAVCLQEIRCDKIVAFSLNISATLLIVVVINVVDYLLSKQK